MVVLAPWAFGAVDPPFEACLLAGIGLLALVQAARMVLTWEVSFRPSGFAALLAGLFALGLIQTLPLPQGLLRTLSPQTAELYEVLLPQEQETLSDGQPIPAPSERGRTLSLYAGATRHYLSRLLAVVLLFLAVHNGYATAASLRRLAVAATLNGFALALFAIVQRVSSAGNQLYWTLTVPTECFGPFLCRNHFPFYLNLCLGLGLGWLGYRLRGGPGAGGGWAWAELLQRPAALWAIGGLGLMAFSVLLSRSRGGVVALLAAAVYVGVVQLVQRRDRLRWDVALVLAGVVLLLAVWFGFDAVTKRLDSLWQGEALQQSRGPLWSMLWPLVPRFPVWGTGLGTFSYVESLPRTGAGDAGLQYEHAHNEYLEMWIEGGTLGLLLVLGLTALALRAGYRTMWQFRDRPAGGLALGASFALATAIVHSIGDFGLHIPAIVLLGTVIVAHLVRLERSDDAGPSAESWSLRWAGAAPAILGGCVALVGVLVAVEGWRTWQVHRLRLVGYAWLTAAEPQPHTRAAGFFVQAATLDPGKARLHWEAGQSLLESAEEQVALWELHEDAALAVPWLVVPLAGTAPAGPGAVLGLPTAGSAGAAVVWAEVVEREQQRLARDWVAPGLWHVVRARDLAPTFGGTHVRLAAYRDALDRADPPERYLQRAVLLVPADPELWYLSGLLAMLRDARETACQHWKRSLELSDRFLPEILGRASAWLGPEETAVRVLPEQPAVLLRAAAVLFPRPEDAAQRQQLYNRALAEYDRRKEPLDAEGRFLQAQLLWELQRRQEAVERLEQALERRPGRVDWRLTYAQWLVALDRWQEAREEVRGILLQQPGHEPARQLWQRISDHLLRHE